MWAFFCATEVTGTSKMSIWEKLKVWKRNPGLELAKDQKKFREEHKGHNLVVACLNKTKGFIERQVPLQDVWQQKVSIYMLVEAGDVPIGIRCSCHVKGMYAAFPAVTRDLSMRLVQQGAGGRAN